MQQLHTMHANRQKRKAKREAAGAAEDAQPRGLTLGRARQEGAKRFVTQGLEEKKRITRRRRRAQGRAWADGRRRPAPHALSTKEVSTLTPRSSTYLLLRYTHIYDRGPTAGVQVLFYVNVYVSRCLAYLSQSKYEMCFFRRLARHTSHTQSHSISSASHSIHTASPLGHTDTQTLNGKRNAGTTHMVCKCLRARHTTGPEPCAPAVCCFAVCCSVCVKYDRRAQPSSSACAAKLETERSPATCSSTRVRASGTALAIGRKSVRLKPPSCSRTA